MIGVGGMVRLNASALSILDSNRREGFNVLREPTWYDHPGVVDYVFPDDKALILSIVGRPEARGFDVTILTPRGVRGWFDSSLLEVVS